MESNPNKIVRFTYSHVLGQYYGYDAYGELVIKSYDFDDLKPLFYKGKIDCVDIEDCFNSEESYKEYFAQVETFIKTGVKGGRLSCYRNGKWGGNMSKYAYIVCADRKYLPEVVAELNSLDFVGNTNDVHFYGYKIPQSVIDQFELLNYKVIFHEIMETEIIAAHGLSEVVCRKRYKFVNDLQQFYDAVCVLDADMVFVADPTNFFTIAEKTGFVLSASKEQNKVYDDPHHMYKGEFLIEKGYYNFVDLCNCPLFVDPKIWGPCLEKSFNIFVDGFSNMDGTNFKAPDMDAMNICLLEAGSANKTIVLPGLAWLGTNEQMLKPYIRVTVNRGQFRTECGIPIFSYHGQFYHEKWRNCQLENRHGCAEGYLGYSEKTDNMARGALELLTKHFFDMLHYKIQIEELDYRHTEG